MRGSAIDKIRTFYYRRVILVEGSNVDAVSSVKAGQCASPCCQVERELARSWSVSLVRCSACKHSSAAAGPGAVRFSLIDCGVFNSLRSGEQSRVCLEFEVK